MHDWEGTCKLDKNRNASSFTGRIAALDDLVVNEDVKLMLL